MENLNTILLCAILFSSVVTPHSATTHTVDWSLRTDYTSLTNGKAFVLGDTLVFNYGSGHTVDEVTQSDYQSCTVGNSISSDSSGTTSISLKTPGTHYFICAAPGHCSGGMKLAVTVAAAGAGSGSTATPTPSSGGGTSSTNPTTTGENRPTGSSDSAAVSPSLATLFVTWVSALYVLVIS